MKSADPNSPSFMRGQTERIAAVMPSSFLALYAKLVVAMVFILICAGALVTGHKAALSDPTWPTFQGRIIPGRDTWKGVIAYEDAHRIVAGTTAILTVILAVWLYRREPRTAVRRLGGYAVLAVFAQAALGGAIILLGRPDFVSMIHATLGQTFFLLVIAIAVVTSPRWTRSAGYLLDRPGNVSLQRETKMAVGVVFLQLIVGSGVRHSQNAFVAHLVVHITVALLVVFALTWLAMRIWREYRDVPPLRRGIHAAIGLVGVQALLGIVAVFINRARAVPDFQPPFWHAGLSTAHVAVGAAILATVFILTLRTHHLLVGPDAPPVDAEGMGKAKA